MLVSIDSMRVVEGNERFLIRLSHPSPGFELADSVGLGTIVNDERPRFDATRAGLTEYDIGNLAPAFGYADGDIWPDLPLDRNSGFGEFEQMPGMAAVLTLGNHHGSAWCDYDRDGRDDLVLTPYAESDTASRIQLFHNLGDGAFEDVAPALGMDVLGLAETPVWGDFDGDGSLDLYCAQHLFLNDGTAHFTDVRELVGLPRLFDEGAKFVDVDGDGDLDLYLRSAEGPRLFRNDTGQFVEISEQAGLAPRAFYWGDSWADVDLDGDLDASLGGSMREILVSHLDEMPGARRAAFRVWVLDADSMMTCPGAIARLREIGGGPGTFQTRVVDGGSGYLSQCEYPLHFGGIGTGRYSLEVRYPGSPTTATDARARARHLQRAARWSCRRNHGARPGRPPCKIAGPESRGRGRAGLGTA